MPSHPDRVRRHYEAEPSFVEFFRAYVERSEWPKGKSFATFAREIWQYLQTMKN